MNFSPIQIQQSDPIPVVLRFEDALGGTKCFERLREPAKLKQRDAAEHGGFGLFVTEAKLFEQLHRAAGKRCRVFRQIELKVDFSLIEIAERKVTQAAGGLELFTKTRTAL